MRELLDSEMAVTKQELRVGEEKSLIHVLSQEG